MNEELVTLQKDIVEITKTMAERITKSESEVKELSDKLVLVMKEAKERKHQFDTSGTGLSMDAKQQRAMEEKMDELFIAKALCTNSTTQRFDSEAYSGIVKSADYASAVDVIKASGFTFAGQTDATGVGGDFIPPGFSQTMLSDIYLALEMAALAGRFTMTTPAYTWPFAADRYAARLAAESVASTKEIITTSQIIFTAKKLMTTVDFTDEIALDSIAALLPFIRQRVVESFALAQEQIFLNGDPTDALNGAVGIVGADDARRLQRGVRSLLNAGEKVDFAVGGLTADNLRTLREKMGKYGKNPSDLAYVLSMGDYLKTLKFTGYQALYQYAGAVITTGELGRLDNIPLVITELMPTNLNATGVYDGITMTKTTCGLVNKNSYKWGDLKQFGMETFRNPIIQATTLVGSQRLDFKKILPAIAPTAAFGINY